MSYVGFESGDDGRNLRKPVRGLNNGKSSFFEELENPESLQRVGFLSVVRKDPLYDHAGVKHHRGHGRPCLLALRITLSRRGRVRFRNCNNFSMTRARCRRRRFSSTA